MEVNVEQTANLRVHQGAVYCLERGPDADSFFSAGGEGVVILWNLAETDKHKAVAAVNAQIFSMLFIPHKNHLLLGTMSGGLHVIDLTAKKEIHYFTIHEQSVFDIKMLDQRIYAASKDGTLSVWADSDYRLERVITVSDAALRVIEFGADKTEAAIGCSDNKVYLLDLLHWKINAVLSGPSNSVFSVCFLDDKKLILAGSRDAQLYFFNSQQHILNQQIKAHLYTINHIVSVSNGEVVITASRDKTIRLWRTGNFELLKSVDHVKNNGHVNSVNKLLWLETNQQLISCSDDHSVIVWKINFTAG